MDFFDLIQFPEDKSPVDNTEIVQVLLYFDQDENKEFKRLCKELMKREWPEDYMKKGNLSDLLLRILKKQYEENNLIAQDDRKAS